MSGTGSMERKKITALLSLLAVTLLAHTLLLQPPRSTDRVLCLSAFRFDGLQLVNRRNMILLCNAILLVILKDAGLLAAPARRRRTCSDSTAAGRDDDACSEPQPKPPKSSTIVVELTRSSTAAACAFDETPAPRLRRGKPSTSSSGSGPGPAHEEYYAAVREIDQRPERCCFYYQAGVVGTDEIAGAEEDKMACLHSQPAPPVADNEERSRGREKMARQGTQPECVDDVDEMNKRFEEFIATMRRKMQLESRQLVKV
uniref:Uncharacterized protein n=1 Tax=Avena sativa TaxID=4498 RepID=A0ACD5U3S6_AVESA